MHNTSATQAAEHATYYAHVMHVRTRSKAQLLVERGVAKHAIVGDGDTRHSAEARTHQLRNQIQCSEGEPNENVRQTILNNLLSIISQHHRASVCQQT